MKDEALKLALEALERSVATCFTQYSHQQVMSHPEHFINQAITTIKQALAAPVQEPVGWISNKDFEPIRIRIMQEAYELADSNDFEGYNAIKVMCGDVQKMLSPQRTWVGLTEEDLKPICDEWRIVYGAWMDDFAKEIEAKLKEKNT